MASTGDVSNNLSKLRSQLRRIKYGGQVDTHSAAEGLPEAFLPLIHYATIGFSDKLARFLAKNGQ
eukprot:gene13967-24635_t